MDEIWYDFKNDYLFALYPDSEWKGHYFYRVEEAIMSGFYPVGECFKSDKVFRHSCKICNL